MRRAQRYSRPGLSSAVNSALLLNNDGDGSTLTLDFTTGVLDPRLTYSRLGNGTFINSQGYVEWAATNALSNSVFAGASGATQPTGWILSFIGGTGSFTLNGTELTISNNGSATRSRIYQTGPTGNGLPVTVQLKVVANNTSGIALVELLSFAINGQGSVVYKVNGTTQLSSFTGWVAGDTVTLTCIPTAGSAATCLFGLGASGTVSTSASVTIKDVQIEPGSVARSYIATTTSGAYHAPRFDHDPTTFAPRGLLFEGEGENRALNSETFPTTGTGQWGPTGVNQNATRITSPDGTANAIQFNETTNNELHRINQGITGSTGPYTISICAKALDTGSPRRLFLNAVGFMNASALFDLDPAVQTGASGSAVAVAGTAANRAGTWIKYPNGWYRCILVGQYNTNSSLFLQINRASSTTASDDTYAGSATNGLALWGVQVEKGVGASSYIPTGVSQEARVAESCVMNDITALNYSAQQGTIYWNGRFNRQPYDSYVTVVGFMTAIDQPAFETFSNAANYFVAARGSNLATSGANETSRPYTLNTAIKYAATANTVTDPVVRGNLNGSASVANKSGTGDMHVATRFVIGRQPVGTYGVNYPSLTLAQIKYWPFAKSAAELSGLTAP
jgi:hypothetical protein